MHGEKIPDESKKAIGTYIHGCDCCQVACPRNQKVMKNAVKKDPFLEQLAVEFSLERILFIGDEYYGRVVYPIMHNYIRNLDIFRRNAAIALGNTGDSRYIEALKTACSTGAPMVREAAVWALKKIIGIREKGAPGFSFENKRE